MGDLISTLLSYPQNEIQIQTQIQIQIQIQNARPDPNFGILSPNISRATMLMIMIQIGLSEKIGTK